MHRHLHILIALLGCIIGDVRSCRCTWCEMKAIGPREYLKRRIAMIRLIANLGVIQTMKLARMENPFYRDEAINNLTRLADQSVKIRDAQSNYAAGAALFEDSGDVLGVAKTFGRTTRGLNATDAGINRELEQLAIDTQKNLGSVEAAKEYQSFSELGEAAMKRGSATIQSVVNIYNSIIGGSNPLSDVSPSRVEE